MVDVSTTSNKASAGLFDGKKKLYHSAKFFVSNGYLR
jgi:hypothetical protein